MPKKSGPKQHFQGKAKSDAHLIRAQVPKRSGPKQHFRGKAKSNTHLIHTLSRAHKSYLNLPSSSQREEKEREIEREKFNLKRSNKSVEQRA